ncbi:hypothetical protein LINGRAHAP2_LOCUS17998 [Linum grandiflorum]
MKAKYKYYKKVLGGDTNNGTTHLRNHTTRYIQRQLHDGTQKNIKLISFLKVLLVKMNYVMDSIMLRLLGRIWLQ